MSTPNSKHVRSAINKSVSLEELIKLNRKLQLECSTNPKLIALVIKQVRTKRLKLVRNYVEPGYSFPKNTGDSIYSHTKVH